MAALRASYVRSERYVNSGEESILEAKVCSIFLQKFWNFHSR